jgi:hypothetical protein
MIARIEPAAMREPSPRQERKVPLPTELKKACLDGRYAPGDDAVRGGIPHCGRDRIRRFRNSKTTNLASINMTQLRATPVPLPPMSAQKAFATFVTRHEQLRATHVEALRQADHLFQTLLHQAFITQ